jgi:hypothetical protein
MEMGCRVGCQNRRVADAQRKAEETFGQKSVARQRHPSSFDCGGHAAAFPLLGHRIENTGCDTPGRANREIRAPKKNGDTTAAHNLLFYVFS